MPTKEPISQLPVRKLGQTIIATPEGIMEVTIRRLCEEEHDHKSSVEYRNAEDFGTKTIGQGQSDRSSYQRSLSDMYSWGKLGFPKLTGMPNPRETTEERTTSHQVLSGLDYENIDLDSEEEVKRAGDVAAAFYIREEARLLRDGRYRDKYIAIVGKRVVDCDQDEIELVTRIEEDFPNALALIQKVCEEEITPVHITGIHIGDSTETEE